MRLVQLGSRHRCQRAGERGAALRLLALLGVDLQQLGPGEAAQGRVVAGGEPPVKPGRFVVAAAVEVQPGEVVEQGRGAVELAEGERFRAEGQRFVVPAELRQRPEQVHRGVDADVVGAELARQRPGLAVTGQAAVQLRPCCPRRCRGW